MPTLKEIRQQYPDYSDMSDQELSDALYKQHYSDMPREEFDKALTGIDKPIPDTSLLGRVKQAGYGILEGVPDFIESLSPTKMGPEPDIRGKTKEQLENYQLPRAKSLAEETFNFPPPSDTLDKYVRAGGRSAIGGLATPGGPIARLLYGPGAGVLGEAASQASEAVGGEKEAPWARILGSVLGPVVARKAITPNTLNNPVRQQQYETAVRESGGRFVPTAGQLFEDQAQINKELAADKGINNRQKAAITETITQHAGDQATDITSGSPGDWVDRNMRRTGNNIDNLERNTYIQHPRGNTILPNGNVSYAFPDAVNVAMRRPQDVSGILKTIEDTSSRLTPHNTALPEERIHSALFNSIGTRRLTGEEYKRLRSNLHSAAESAGTPESAHAYRQIANVLDNAMATTNSNWANSWGRTRREYAHALVGQELAARGKQGQTRFSPDEIAAASKSVAGKSPWVRGEFETAPFISSAGAFPPLKKGKVPEQYPAYQKIPIIGPLAGHALNMGPILGGALAAGASHLHGMPPEAVLSSGIWGSILGAGPLLAKNVRPMVSPMNPYMQAYKKNQFIPLSGSQAQRNNAALVRALLSAQPQNQQ